MVGHYLMFNRNCAEALEVYANAFNAKITEIQKYGDMPPDPAFPVAESDKGLVLHVRLNINGQEIMERIVLIQILVGIICLFP